MARLIEKVVGHESVFQSLKASLDMGKVAPSLIFSGPSGVGKRMMAMAWAQTLLCESEANEPCGVCPSCVQMSHGYHSNLKIVEAEKTSIKIDQTKEVAKSLSLRKSGKRMVVIFDEADKLTAQAANSILKIVEEPPEGTHFIFVTSSFFALLSTIRSRSQRVLFQPLTKSQLQQITGERGWVLGSAQGRVDQLEKLVGEEHSEMRSLAVRVLPMMFDESRWTHAREALSGVIKDREKLGFINLVWKQLLRDSFLQAESERIHQDCNFQYLSGLDQELRLQTFQKFVKLDKSLEGNADTQLTVESLIIDLKENIHGERIHA